MSEYDEFELAADGFEDHELREQIADLSEQLADQQEEAEISSAISQLQAAHGVNLTPDQFQTLGEAIDQGHDPQEAFEELGYARDSDFDARFIQTVQQQAEKQGSPLSDAQVDALWEAAQYRDDPTHVEEGVVLDLGKRTDRIELIDERFREATAPERGDSEQTVEPLPADATKEQRIAYLDARAAGAQPTDQAEED
jgi:hypothetical protein